MLHLRAFVSLSLKSLRMPDREELLLAEMHGITARRELKQHQYFVLVCFDSFSELTAAIFLNKGIKVYRFSKITPTPFVVSL